MPVRAVLPPAPGTVSAAAGPFQKRNLPDTLLMRSTTSWSDGPGVKLFQACHAARCMAVDSGVTPGGRPINRVRIRTLAAGT